MSWWRAKRSGLRARACEERAPSARDRCRVARGQAESQHTQRPARRFKELVYRTRKSWCRPRRVVAKAEQTGDKANPRFIVTSLSMQQWAARELYEDLYCARGECENRIKEAQLDLFTDRLSAATFRANQLRLWLASAAYVLMHALRRVGLAGSALARACGEYDPAEAAEDRRRRHVKRTAREACDERGLPQPARVHRRLPRLSAAAR